MAKKAFSASRMPAPVGPYSPGLQSGRLVFISGQIPLRADGSVAGEDSVTQVRQSLENLKELLAEVGLGMKDVVKTTVFIVDMADFAAINEIYAAYFSPPFPARSMVEVSALPKGARVEIEAIAVQEGT